MTLDYHTTTVEAAAAMAREDPDDDRPTLGELADEDYDRAPTSAGGQRETCWVMDEEAGW